MDLEEMAKQELKDAKAEKKYEEKLKTTFQKIQTMTRTLSWKLEEQQERRAQLFAGDLCQMMAYA